MNNLPSLNDLKLFSLVARNLSFVATAKELGVSRAFVSKRVAVLEDLLKVRLLHRSTRRVRITEDGQAVFDWTQRILEDVGLMKESVSASKIQPKGLIKISASAGFGRMRVAPALSELGFLYPDLQFKLEILARPVDLIGEGFDLDIRIGGESDPNLMVKRIATNERILCAAPRYLKQHGVPKRIEELAEHDCIVIRERDHSFGIWQLKGPKRIETVRVAGRFSSNNGEIIHNWALAGHGIMLRSTWAVESDLGSGKLVRILPEYKQMADISTVYPFRLAESAKIRICVEFLQQWLLKKKFLVE